MTKGAHFAIIFLPKKFFKKKYLHKIFKTVIIIRMQNFTNSLNTLMITDVAIKAALDLRAFMFTLIKRMQLGKSGELS